MPHKTYPEVQVFYVRTFGQIKIEERLSIIKAMFTNPNGNRGNRALVIDHSEAQIDVSVEEAYEFGKTISELTSHSSEAKVFIIPSESNRRNIDLSVSTARNAGVQIRVCEDRTEVLEEILRLETSKAKIFDAESLRDNL